MIIRDEAKNLERCLASIHGFADETVVIDTGSQDDSVSIARRCGARVFEEVWREDFSFHRNQSIRRSKGEWIFVIDGDEVLEDVADLGARFLQEAQTSGYDSVLVRVDTHGDAGLMEQFRSPRLFLRAKGKYQYPVHNQLVGVDKAVSSQAVIRSSYEGTMQGKANRSIPILERLHSDDPEDPHAPFYLAMTYRALANAELTRQWARLSTSLRPRDPQYAAAWVWLFGATLALEGPTQAQSTLQEGLAHHPGLADLHHCQMVVSACFWVQAASAPSYYATVAQMSPKYVRNLSAAASLLGFPITVTQE